MCGIAGWVSYDRDLRTETATLDAMTRTMACRGPDDSGTWIGGAAALGHRRLAIIDLPGGRQPMTAETPEGTVALVYSSGATRSPSVSTACTPSRSGTVAATHS